MPLKLRSMGVLIAATATLCIVASAGSAKAANADCTRYDAADIAGDPGSLFCAAELGIATLPGAGYRILYRTRGAAGEPVAASGLVFLPDIAASKGSPSTGAILLAHATVGIDAACGPSLSWQPADTKILPGVVAVLHGGKAVIAPDYIGLGATASDGSTPPHPYLDPQAAANAVFDAAIAAKALPDFLAGAGATPPAVHFDGNLVMVGHSQGGHAVLSAMAPTLDAAPELQLKGLVVSGVPYRIDRLVTLLRSDDGAIITAYLLETLENANAGLDLTAIASSSFIGVMPDLLQGCLHDETAHAARIDKLTKADLLSDPLTGEKNVEATFGRQLVVSALPDGWREAFEALTPSLPTRDVDLPILLVQGGLDELVLPFITSESLRLKLCQPSRKNVRVLFAPLLPHDESFERAGGEILKFASAAMSGQTYDPPVSYDPAKKTETLVPLICADIPEDG